jgi:hypothetical protein
MTDATDNAVTVAEAAGVPADHESVAALAAAAPYGGGGLLSAAIAALHRRLRAVEHPAPAAQDTAGPAAGIAYDYGNPGEISCPVIPPAVTSGQA